MLKHVFSSLPKVGGKEVFGWLSGDSDVNSLERLLFDTERDHFLSVGAKYSPFSATLQVSYLLNS